MKQGKLIVIEGTDASGKQTQSELLVKKLTELGHKVRRISFPNYGSKACAPVEMYLAGEFGTEATKINPYPISTMYAIDRYASFKTDWGKFYNDGGIIVTDRYTTSNMVHQASKIDDITEKKVYLEWLEDLEYDKIGIPRPDMVIFLNMPTENAVKLMAERMNKITGESKKDIHEQDSAYLSKSHKNACEIAVTQGWKEISCVINGEVRTIDDIGDDVFKVVDVLLD